MKNVLTIFFMAMLLVGCTSEPSVGDKAVALISDKTEKIKSVQSFDDLMQMTEDADFQDQLIALDKEAKELVQNGDSSKYLAEVAKVKDAYANLETAYNEKVRELIPGLPDSGYDSLKSYASTIVEEPEK